MASAVRNDRPGLATIAVRTLAATVGAYAVAFFLAPALAVVFARMAVERADAVMIATTLALLAFPAVSVWAFAERRTWVVAAAPIAASAVFAVIALVLKP